MKKITLFAFAVVALSLASCKKDRTCECTYTQTGTTNTISDKQTTDYKKIKKADAEYMCDKIVYTNTHTQTSGNVTVTDTDSYTSSCEVK